MHDHEEAILQFITPVFREVFEEPNLQIARELEASQVKKWDSLNHIVLILELEKRTGITLTTDELASMVKVGDYVDILKHKGFTP